MLMHPQRSQNRGRRWTIAGIVTGIVAIAGFIAVAALNGIIGNAADSIFRFLVGHISQTKIDLSTWITVLVAALICLIIFFFFLWRSSRLGHRILNLERENRVLRHALDTEHNIVSLDDSLLRLLASWVPSRDHANEMRLIIAELLSDATAEFNGHVHRAAVLRPDGDCLKIWAHYGMPEESVKQLCFYIGSDRSRQRGVAGEAFLNQQLRVGHMKQAGNTWICDDSDYANGRKRPYPPYMSFIVIPIIGVSATSTAGNIATCLGVICFDSLQIDIFDSSEYQAVLRVFARRVAAALLIFEQLP